LNVVVVYDISNTILRNKLAKELFLYGFRVQKSVFEADLNKIELKKLKLMASCYSNDTDKVSIYTYTKVLRYGTVEIIEQNSLIF